MSRPRTIYLIDSDEDDRFIYQQVIATIDYTILIKQAATIDEFLHAIELEGLAFTSLIIVDTYSMYGTNSLIQLLTNTSLKDIEIVLISSLSESEIKNELSKNSGLKYYPKPYSFTELHKLLEELITTYLSE